MASQLVIDIARRFPERSIIARSTFEIPSGRPLVLFGPSGSGKTTILRSIAGLERPDEGVIVFDDETWFDSARRIMVTPQERRVGYLSQSYDLFPHLTVRENVAYGTGPEFALDELLARLGIASLAGRRPGRLSGGEKQRVALARALAREPRILLLDEPLSALDAPTRTSLRTTLRTIVEQSAIPALIVTHDRTEALALGDTIAVVIDGTIAQYGTVESVFNHPVSVAVAKATGVETVIPVEITSNDGSIVIARAGSIEIECVPRDSDALGAGSRAFALIHAHEVTIERHRTEGISARNQLTGTVRTITSEGPLVRVGMDCGFELTALITAASARELAIGEGSEVLATIKASAMQLVPR